MFEGNINEIYSEISETFLSCLFSYEKAYHGSTNVRLRGSIYWTKYSGDAHHVNQQAPRFWKKDISPSITPGKYLVDNSIYHQFRISKLNKMKIYKNVI